MTSSGKPGGRTQRIEAQMQRELAELLRRDVNDPRVGMVTITQVELVPDLSQARVLYVPFGLQPEGEDEAKALARSQERQEGLQAAARFLRGEVARRVGLRHAPRLIFVADDSFDRAARLSALIGKPVKGEDQT
jgi:ribosome-binding factor A